MTCPPRRLKSPTAERDRANHVTNNGAAKKTHLPCAGDGRNSGARAGILLSAGRARARVWPSRASSPALPPPARDGRPRVRPRPFLPRAMPARAPLFRPSPSPAQGAFSLPPRCSCRVWCMFHVKHVCNMLIFSVVYNCKHIVTIVNMPLRL